MEPSAVLLWRDESQVRVSVRFCVADGTIDAPTEAGVGFLTARHLGLDILLAAPGDDAVVASPASEAEVSTVPDVFRPRLESLQWDEL